MDDSDHINDLLRSPDVEVRLQAIDSAGRLGDPSLIEALLGLLGDSDWRARKAAAATLGGFRNKVEIVGLLIGVICRTHDIAAKNTALECLIGFGEASLDSIIQVLPQASADAKKILLEALGQIGNQSVAPSVRLLLNDSDENVRLAAIETLGKVRDRKALPDLLGLCSDDDYLIAFTAVKAVGAIGDAASAAELKKHVIRRGMERVVLEALGEIGDVHAAEAMFQALGSQNPKTRVSGLAAVNKLRERLSEEEITRIDDEFRNRVVTNSLIEWLHEESKSGERSRAENAIRALGWTRDVKVCKPLLELLSIDNQSAVVAALSECGTDAVPIVLGHLFSPNAEPKTAIIRILGGLLRNMSHAGASASLVRFFGNPEAEIRVAAAEAIGEIADRESAASLMSLLSDEEAVVRDAAMKSLSKLAGPDLLPLLLECVSSQNANLRANAVLLLGGYQSREAVNHLLFAVKDENPSVRLAAVEALGKIDSRIIEDHLVLALTDESAPVRNAALHRLIDLNPPNLTDRIMPMLNDEDIWVRASAVRAFIRSGGSKNRSEVETLLKDSNGVVRIAAIEAISETGDLSLVSLITSLTRASDSEVARSAIEAVGRLGDRNNILELYPLLQHDNWSVRAAVVDALSQIRDQSSLDALRNLVTQDPSRIVRQKAEGAVRTIVGS